MAIKQINTLFTGEIGVNPRLVAIISSDNLATVTTAGYLNSKNLQGYVIYPTDLIYMFYGYVSSASPGTFAIFNATVTNPGVITLVEWTNPGNVLLPVVAGDFAVFSSTDGQIEDSGLMPSAASQAFVVTSPGSLTTGQLAEFKDANGTLENSGLLASNAMSKAAANAMGAGGSITFTKVNGTETSNAVTASGVAGVISTSSLSTAGGGSYAITWTNTKITGTSVVLLSIEGGTNSTQNITMTVAPGTGSATLTIYNNTAATALNGTIFIGYVVL